MMDAQEKNESSTNLSSLILGEAVEGDTVGNPAESSTRKQRPLTDDELVDNAFLMLIAGYVDDHF